MDTIRWALKDYLEEHGLTAYALIRASELAPNTVYSLARGTTNQVRLDTIAGLLGGLRKLTGGEVRLEDVLIHEVVPDPKPDELDEESRAWLYAPLTPPLEPWEWGPEGEPAGKTVAVEPDGAFYIAEEDAA